MVTLRGVWNACTPWKSNTNTQDTMKQGTLTLPVWLKKEQKKVRKPAVNTEPVTTTVPYPFPLALHQQNCTIKYCSLYSWQRSTSSPGLPRHGRKAQCQPEVCKTQAGPNWSTAFEEATRWDPWMMQSFNSGCWPWYCSTLCSKLTFHAAISMFVVQTFAYTLHLF